jgi:hypothetical protein
MLSKEERYALMDANPPEIDAIHHANVYFDWAWKGCGFGQLSFSVDKETGKITCMNECMSRDRIRKILTSLANHIADNAELDCDTSKET